MTGGRVADRCTSVGASRNHHTVTKGGSANATGGSSTAGVVFQQNTAQQGRQNTACANPNDTAIVVTGGRVADRCTSVDASRNHHTVTKGGSAHATGGSAAAVFQ